jgi:uncharacterized protein YjbI with pentapeptide repeats
MDQRLVAQVSAPGYVDLSQVERLVIERERLEGVDFSGRILLQFVAISSSFLRCRFERTVIASACFGGGKRESTYESCSFDGSKIHAAAPGVARFIRCSFRDATIEEFFGLSVSMIDCEFSGVLRRVVFYGRNPTRQRWWRRTRNDFRGNDFRFANLADVAFREGIELASQKLPSGWVAPKDAYDDVRNAT